MKASPYWIINARLESGYVWDQGAIRETQTELCDLLIENGKITRIEPSSEILEDGIPKKDTKGLLILPSMAEKHIHLEKTYYGGLWKATTPVKNLFERHAEDMQRSTACGQRVWKRHPVGGLIGDGTSPRRMMRSCFLVASGTGIADKSAWV